MKTTDPNEQTELDKTPRTNAAQWPSLQLGRGPNRIEEMMVPVGIARTLERELNAATHRAQEAERERDEARNDANLNAKDLCQIEDWLIGNKEFDPKTGLVDRCKLIKERIRDLIAKEGELGDLQYQLSSAQEALKLAVEALTDIDYDLKDNMPEYERLESTTIALSHPAIQAILGKEGDVK